MQDDAYLISVDGWKAATYRVIEQMKNKDGKVTKEVDKGWACDLVPKALIVARYFATQQAAIDALRAELDMAEAQLTEIEEEHSGEDAVFAGFDKINTKAVKERLDEVEDDADAREEDAREEIAVLKQWLQLDRNKSALKKKLKDAEAELDNSAHDKYPKLSEAEIKRLVVDDKWLATLDAAIHGEMDRISQALTRRVKELAERYDTPLPLLAGRVDELQTKVDAHLQRMGFVWQ